MGIASIGGKDSMSGSYNDIHVPPTLCSFAICHAKKGGVISPEFKAAGHKLYLVDIDRDECRLPIWSDVNAKLDMVTELIGSRKIYSAYAVERGGILAGAAKTVSYTHLTTCSLARTVLQLGHQLTGASFRYASPCL